MIERIKNDVSADTKHHNEHDMEWIAGHQCKMLRMHLFLHQVQHVNMRTCKPYYS